MLPFANISGDKEEEYFADGMTDDLITDLSKISALLVMSRNSVFRYAQDAMKHSGQLDDDAPLLQKPFRKPELARMLRTILDT